MKKTKIYSVGNIDKFNYLLVEKRRDFFEFANKLFSKADNRIKIERDLKNYDYDPPKTIKRSVEKLIDKHESHSSKKIRIDIFYGRKRVYITFITHLANREKIMDSLEKIGEFVKYKN